MAELNYLARPYARAAYEYAVAEKQVPQWLAQLNLLAQLVATPKVEKILRNPNFSDVQKAAFCVSLVEEKKLSKAMVNFIKTLAENKRLIALPAIATLFTEMRAAEEQEIKVQVSSVQALDQTTQQQLLEVLQKKLNCCVKLEYSLDPNLIGGLLIRANDLVIDGSLRGELQRLREALVN